MSPSYSLDQPLWTGDTLDYLDVINRRDTIPAQAWNIPVIVARGAAVVVFKSKFCTANTKYQIIKRMLSTTA